METLRIRIERAMPIGSRTYRPGEIAEVPAPLARAIIKTGGATLDGDEAQTRDIRAGYRYRNGDGKGERRG